MTDQRVEEISDLERTKNLARSWIRYWKWEWSEPPFDDPTQPRPVKPHGGGRSASPLGMTEKLLGLIEQSPTGLDEAHAHAAGSAAEMVGDEVQARRLREIANAIYGALNPSKQRGSNDRRAD